jgi:hypothetical protein
MRWVKRNRDPYRWRTWFAWFPTTLIGPEGKFVMWLEWYEWQMVSDTAKYFEVRLRDGFEVIMDATPYRDV